MEPEDIFQTIVVLFIGAIIIIAISGNDPGVLISILPDVIIFAVILALAVAFLRIIFD